MEGLEYLLVEPACEVNEKGTRDKNDGNENLSLDDNKKIDADSEAESFVEEDWNDPEQGEVPKWTEPDLSIPVGTRSGNRKRTGMRYNRYGDDFLIDKIQPDDLSKELISVGELAADGEWQIIDDNEHYPQEDYSTPERETDLELSEIERRENTNLRILEWMRDVKNESEEGQSIQQVDISAGKYTKTEDPLFGWTATDSPLDIPPDNSDPASSTGTSIIIFLQASEEEDFKPQRIKMKRGSTSGQTWEVDVGKEWVSNEHQATGKQVPSDPLEKNKTRNTARPWWVALETLQELEDCLKKLDSGVSRKRRNWATQQKAGINKLELGSQLKRTWQNLLKDHFEEAMRTSSSASPLMANPFIGTAGQLMFAWSLLRIELETLTSYERARQPVIEIPRR